MPKIEEIRTGITEIDAQLLTLLAKRRNLALNVAQSKIENHKPVRDTSREQDLLVELINKGKNLGLDSHYITQVFHSILKDSVLFQQSYLQKMANPDETLSIPRVAHLGGLGSYSSLACKQYFAQKNEKIIA